MRSVLIFGSYLCVAMGALLMAIGGFSYIDGNAGTTMMAVTCGGALFCGGIIGGMKINS